ncbi:MAG: hypothetical protein BWK80_27450 [Desulfobacteraceae bacterium IS3]|nr:MAG: hypothetical protein BWK80_27450 [Desulfobacteraceae bacterium IS3]
MKKTVKWAIIAISSLVLIAGIAIVGITEWMKFSEPATEKMSSAFETSDPDAMIITESLSRLPRDLLSNPILKEVLTEDFLFYYEYNEGRLGLRGTLRRISYEHDLTFVDEILSYVFNTPAEIMFWKGYDGRLRKYCLAVSTSGLAPYISFAARVASDDKQLKLIGSKASEGKQIPVYELRYAPHRKLYFAAGETYTYIFSNRDMALPEKKKAEKQPESKTFSDTARKKFAAISGQINDRGNHPAHTVFVSLRYISFGYQRFFPNLESLCFEYRNKTWTVSALTKNTGKAVDSTDLWKAVPSGTGMCAALPADLMALKDILGSVATDSQADIEALLSSVQSPAALCWYPDSEIYTPLLVVKSDETKDMKSILGTLFEKSTGAVESRVLTQKQKEKLTEKVHTEHELAGMERWKTKYGYFLSEEEGKELEVERNRQRLEEQLEQAMGYDLRWKTDEQLQSEIETLEKKGTRLTEDQRIELEDKIKKEIEPKLRAEIKENWEKEIKENAEKKAALREKLAALKKEVETYKVTGPFKVAEVSDAGKTVWTRDLSSRYGLYDAAPKDAKTMRSSRYFKVCLAYQKGYVMFSPDHRLVEKAIATLDKKYPPAADSMPSDTANKILILYPENIGRLLKKSVSDSLPEYEESVFRESVSRYLFPVLDKTAYLPAVALRMPSFSIDTPNRWEDLKWENLSSR